MGLISGLNAQKSRYRTRGQSRKLHTALQLSSVAIMLAGLAVTIGWILDIPVLKSLIPNAVTMKFSTAMSFALTGLSILLISKIIVEPKRYSNIFQIIMPISLLVILLFMTTHLASIILNAPSGLDNLFVREGSDPLLTTSPGRPSLPTVLSFFLVIAASAGTMYTTSQSNLKRLLLGTGLGIGAFGAIAIAGYVFSLPALYYAIEGVNTAMAVHTAILFAIAGTVMVIMASNRLGQVVETQTSATIASKSGGNASNPSMTISFRTKLVCLFLAVSIIPIVFIGGVSSNNSKTYSSAALTYSVEILGVATAASVGFFALIISKSILQPIMSLRNAAKMIAAGQFDIKVPVQTGDEIGELASDFAKMQESVLATNRNLERLVELRTLELGDANKQLALANNQLSVANEQLMKQEKKMHDFISIAAHELKSPISPILVATSLVERSEADKQIKLSKDEFDMIVRNAKRLKLLAEDILDVTRIESNLLVLRRQRFDLNRLILSIADDFKTQIRENKRKQIEILYESDEDIEIEADKERFVQVLYNLLNNASKFTDDGSIVITVRKDVSASQVVLSVKDTGKGIEPEILPRLFMKFTTNSEKGTGLGLYISKNIVEAHGGKIWAENNKDSKGATFTFTIPAALRVSSRN